MYVKSLIVFVVLFSGVRPREFQFLNTLPGDVWMGSQGNPGHEHLNGGGWRLGVGERMSIHTADNWAGRFWARSWCNVNGDNHCETGDCGNKLQCNGAGGQPPATLAEITLKGWGDLDYYDISLVDGYNLKMSMTPLGGQGTGDPYSCKSTACGYEINNDCPQELRLYGSGGVIGCKSACLAFNTDEYCCRGAHNRPETCKSSNWPVDYPKFFKDRCPDAYSYAYDDHKSTFTCNAPAYLIAIG